MTRRHRRHPNEVTSDRLADFLDKYDAELDGADRDAIAWVRYLLWRHSQETSN